MQTRLLHSVTACGHRTLSFKLDADQATSAGAVVVVPALLLLLLSLLQSPDWYSEDQVGAGIAAARLPRDQLFLVSKVHPRDFGRNGTLAACKRSINKLAAGYLDLLLLHYPFCTPGTNCITTPHMRWQDSWMALEELVAAKLTRSIGMFCVQAA